MTAAHCGTVSALTLGLGAATAIPEVKGPLSKAVFAKGNPSAKLRHRLAVEIDSIVMLALMRPANAHVTAGSGKVPEILVIGLRLAAGMRGVPTEVIDLIAGQRHSGIVFACIRETEHEGALREECAFAVRRNVPVRAGHVPVTKVYAGAWKLAGESVLEPFGDTMDDLWDSLCAQALLDDIDGARLDERLAARDLLARLKADEAKLTRNHARAKDPQTRNEIYARLHRIRAQIDSMS